jgi:hypothetical protein
MSRTKFLWLSLIFLAGVFLFVLYLSNDPTVPWQESQVRLKRLIMKSIPEGKAIIEDQWEPFFYDKIPGRTKFRYQNRQLATGLPNSSYSLLFEVQGGRIRCYSHYFQGRTSSFTVLHSDGCSAAAQKFKRELTQEFPNLPVTMQESESLRLEDPAG